MDEAEISADGMPEDVLEAFDREVRYKPPMVASAYRREVSGPVCRAIGPHATPSHNWIDHYRFSMEDAHDFVAAQVEAYSEIGHQFRWKVYDHDQPEALPEILLKRGFTPGHTSSLMVMRSESCAQQCDAKLDPVAYSVDRVSDPDKLEPSLRPVWDDWADDLLGAIASELAELGEHMAVYVVRVDGAPASAGLIRYDRDFVFGGLFAGRTVPSLRGRGLYRAVLSARAKHAINMGAPYLYIEAGEMSRPIVEKLGFREISQITNYVSPKV